MSDGEQLLLVLGLIYLSGCLFWIDRRTVLFSSWFGRGWRATVADYRWGNSSGRVYLLNPFPPMGYLFAVRVLPVSFSPTAVVAYNVQTVGNSGRPRQSRQVAEIAATTRFSRRGAVLRVDGRSFCDVGDVETAHRLVVLFNGMKGRDTAARELAIADFWRERLALRRTKTRIRKALVASDGVQFLGSFTTVLLFALFPLATYRFGVDLVVVAGAAIMFLTALFLSFAYYRFNRRHAPYFKEGLWGDLMKMLLCPPTALRAGDLMMRKLSASLDPLPLAVLLLRGARRRVFVTHYLADLRDPDLPQGLPPVVRETCLWQNRMILRVAEGALHRTENLVSE